MDRNFIPIIMTMKIILDTLPVTLAVSTVKCDIIKSLSPYQQALYKDFVGI